MVKLSAAPGRTRSRWFEGNSLGLLIAYLVLVVIFAAISPAFLSGPNLVNIAQTLAIVAIVAAGQALVVIAGGVDLSVGATAALSGVVIGLLYNGHLLSIWPATLVGLLAGGLVGLLNGLVVTRLRINAVIATLGSLSIVRGLAFVWTGAETARLEVESFKGYRPRRARRHPGAAADHGRGVCGAVCVSEPQRARPPALRGGRQPGGRPAGGGAGGPGTGAGLSAVRAAGRARRGWCWRRSWQRASRRPPTA